MIKTGKFVRIRVENMPDLRHCHDWRRDQLVTGTVEKIAGNRICVNVDGAALWFNAEDIDTNLTLRIDFA